MRAIYALGQKYGFRIIEDASHAIGAGYLDGKVGNCRYSDITVFSFHPVKIITTGEGGMAVTNDAQLVKKMARLRSHGITRYAEEMTHVPDGPWYYQQIELGFNYRLTELQAALGLSQMSRLDQFVSERHELVNRYNKMLANTALILPWQHPDTYSSFHLYIVRLPRCADAMSHKEAFENLRSGGIGVNLHYIPLYKQPYYEAMGFKSEQFPESERYYSEAISLPLFPGLREEDQQEVVQQLTRASGYQTIF
ncbi:UDP-4-amino-4,6-dideoxy-N-acetyl-beta-L-altrosamine transaminase [bioreactor metagenome]|uniref:UDP-4-amino-4, 6-dideoxy-N-acetyl-beta-L-altrosamine transaminase n=1 Tax=bioreactor metagenome TaxID=1076179 RepID=A0A645DVQ7_9ZZZZ